MNEHEDFEAWLEHVPLQRPSEELTERILSARPHSRPRSGTPWWGTVGACLLCLAIGLWIPTRQAPIDTKPSSPGAQTIAPETPRPSPPSTRPSEATRPSVTEKPVEQAPGADGEGMPQPQTDPPAEEPASPRPTPQKAPSDPTPLDVRIAQNIRQKQAVQYYTAMVRSINGEQQGPPSRASERREINRMRAQSLLDQAEAGRFSPSAFPTNTTPPAP